MIEIYFPTFKRWCQLDWLRNIAIGFRGFLKRKSWKSTLAKSGHPENVQNKIRSVVQKTWLMRSEKAAVCNELIAHFEDGINAGNSPAKMLNDFGNESDAATLIARAKKRNRSVIQKSIRGLAWSSLVLAILFAGLTAYFISGTPNPTVDYVSMINSVAIEAKEEDKAWPIYREAWITSRVWKGQPRPLDVTFGNVDGIIQRFEPGDSKWPETVQFLNEHRELLQSIREASKKTHLGVTLASDWRSLPIRDQLALMPNAFDENDELLQDPSNQSVTVDFDEYQLRDVAMMLMLPHVQQLAECSLLLKQDTQLAIEENDSKRAIANIEATLGMANQVSEKPFLVCARIAISIADNAFEQIEFGLAQSPNFFSTEDLKELQSTVSRFSLRRLIRFTGERQMFDDLLQRIYTDDGNGDGRLTLHGKKLLNVVRGFGPDQSQPSTVFQTYDWMPTNMFSIASRKESKNKFDEILRVVESEFDKPVDDFSFDLNDFVTSAELFGKFRLFNIFLRSIKDTHVAYKSRSERRESVVSAINQRIEENVEATEN